MAVRGFDSVIIREDHDLRGRRPGEVPELLRTAITGAYPGLDLQIIPDERTAIQTAVASAAPGDLIVFYCEKADPAADMLLEMGATILSEVEPVAAVECKASEEVM
jgi:cyanophycin synthetase